MTKGNFIYHIYIRFNVGIFVNLTWINIISKWNSLDFTIIFAHIFSAHFKVVLIFWIEIKTIQIQICHKMSLKNIKLRYMKLIYIQYRVRRQNLDFYIAYGLIVLTYNMIQFSSFEGTYKICLFQLLSHIDFDSYKHVV